MCIIIIIIISCRTNSHHSTSSNTCHSFQSDIRIKPSSRIDHFSQLELYACHDSPDLWHQFLWMSPHKLWHQQMDCILQFEVISVLPPMLCIAKVCHLLVAYRQCLGFLRIFVSLITGNLSLLSGRYPSVLTKAMHMNEWNEWIKTLYKVKTVFAHMILQFCVFVWPHPIISFYFHFTWKNRQKIKLINLFDHVLRFLITSLLRFWPQFS